MWCCTRLPDGKQCWKRAKEIPPNHPWILLGLPLTSLSSPNPPKDSTVTPKEAQYHPSTGHISCRRSQNDQIFPVIPTIAQYSLAPTGALLTLWCSLYWLEWTNYHLSACSLHLSVVLTPKKCLAECVDALNDWFRVIKSIIDYLSGCHQILVNILCNWY